MMVVADCIIGPKSSTFSVSTPFDMCLCSNPHLLLHPLTSDFKENAPYIINYSSVIFTCCTVFSLIHMTVISSLLLTTQVFLKCRYKFKTPQNTLNIIWLNHCANNYFLRKVSQKFNCQVQRYMFKKFLIHKSCVTFHSHSHK